MLFNWLERRIDPFAPFDETETPPTTVARFAWHYLKPVRFWLGVLFVASAAVGVVESLFGTYQGDFAPWLGPNFGLVAPYALMLLVLLVRPYGLFGKREVERL